MSDDLKETTGLGQSDAVKNGETDAPAEAAAPMPEDEKKSAGGAEKQDRDETGKKKKIKGPMWKRILKIFLWVLAGLLGLLILIFIFRDSLIRFAVTTVGSKVLGVEITLECEVREDGTILVLSHGITGGEMESETAA